MKKKLTRRVLSLVLAIVLMMSMAIPASATSVSWTSGSYTYEAIVVEGNTTSVSIEMPNSRAVHNGTTTTTCILSSASNTIFWAPTSQFEAQFRSYLIQALNLTPNLRERRTITFPYSIGFPVEPDKALGTYAVFGKITCGQAPWRVDRNSFDLVVSGTLSYAPNANVRIEYKPYPV